MEFVLPRLMWFDVQRRGLSSLTSRTSSHFLQQPTRPFCLPPSRRPRARRKYFAKKVSRKFVLLARAHWIDSEWSTFAFFLSVTSVSWFWRANLVTAGVGWGLDWRNFSFRVVVINRPRNRLQELWFFMGEREKSLLFIHAPRRWKKM